MTNMDLRSLKIYIAPLQSKEFAAPESRDCIEEYHHAKGLIELTKKGSQFLPV